MSLTCSSDIMLVGLELEHTESDCGDDNVNTGAVLAGGATVTAKELLVLVQPVEELVTVSVPVYVAAVAAPGTEMAIGDAGNDADVTALKPAVVAAPLHTILYWSGLLVVAL